MVQFNADEDERLIELVRAEEFLWNMKDPDFRNNARKEATWRRFAKLLNKPRVDVQKRWKSIRDHYRRQLQNEAASAIITKKRAAYWPLLRFLDAEGDERAAEGNSYSEEIPVKVEVDSEDSSSNDYDNMSDSNLQENDYEVEIPIPVVSNADLEPPPKRRRESLMQYLADTETDRNHFKKFLQDYLKLAPQEDEIDMFFKSMAMTVKKFQPDLLSKAKMKVFQIVTEIEAMNRKT